MLILAYEAPLASVQFYLHQINDKVNCHDIAGEITTAEVGTLEMSTRLCLTEHQRQLLMKHEVVELLSVLRVDFSHKLLQLCSEGRRELKHKEWV